RQYRRSQRCALMGSVNLGPKETEQEVTETTERNAEKDFGRSSRRRTFRRVLCVVVVDPFLHAVQVGPQRRDGHNEKSSSPTCQIASACSSVSSVTSCF